MGKLYSIPFGEYFLESLAHGVLEQFGHDPLQLSQVQILLPTRRTCHEIKECFYKLQKGKPLILPRISPLGELGSEPNPELYPDLPPPVDLKVIPPLIRQGLMLQLVEKFQRDSLKGELPKALSLQLTKDLLALIDQSQIEQVPLERLHSIVPEMYASHWQITIDFLKILFEAWPQILKENHYIERYAQHWNSTQNLIQHWKDSPPQTPIIAAGSTGTMPATRLLLKSILSLDLGQVVLPGYDSEIPQDTEVESTHPQYSLRRLVHELDQDILPWMSAKSSSEPAKARAELFRKMVGLKNLPTHPKALENLKLIECKTLSEEALTIAVILREVLEHPTKAALVLTADKDLEDRILLELERWGISFGSSHNLRVDPSGSLISLIGEISKDQFDPISILAFLKHPYLTHEIDVAQLEKKVFRTLRREWGWDLVGSLAALHDKLKPLLQNQSSTLKVEEWIAHLKTVLDNLIPGHEEDLRFETLHDFLENFEDSASGFAPQTYAGFFELLNQLMNDHSLHQKEEGHPRVEVLTVLGARFVKRDLMILAGLNEGSWPPEIHEDPWLSRPMRAAMDFPSPERRIGLSAHDFGHAFSSPEVILTRSLRKNGTPTVPSRFLSRLEVTLKGDGFEIPKDTTYQSWAASLNLQKETPHEFRAPTPPLSARPHEFYVTHVETLRRDPYAYYAKHILKLRPLDPINFPPRPSDRGNLFHKILERVFVSEINFLGDSAWDEIQEIAREEFDGLPLGPPVRRFWWGRFLRFGKWFLKTERDLRSQYPNLKTYVEVEGEITLQTETQTYTLKAKADRLDLYPDGTVSIIDYKTGVPPSAEDVKLGYAPQLPLEGVILTQGGFQKLGARDLKSLAFWHLKGTGAGGEIKEIKGDASLLSQDTKAGFLNLLTLYEDPNQGYGPEPLAEKGLNYNDYEGVSRIKEWRRA